MCLAQEEAEEAENETENGTKPHWTEIISFTTR